MNIARADARTIKIGLIQSYSGVRANFSEPDAYVLGKVQALVKNGLKVGKSTYAVEIVKQDNQSSIAGTAPVANNLLLRQNVDLLLSPTATARWRAARSRTPPAHPPSPP